jgi:hypothetical protein
LSPDGTVEQVVKFDDGAVASITVMNYPIVQVEVLN